ncbi:hypothetical protein OPT61_g7415 [Boeremia exigua]|uniref:Uncharacterized protein n=1 Tax=Boeremia exigua TaxID=749465 RepID=A0ACC2I2Q7_9PLEO|nr:hypothetical protein OPT61_g7415 [Boeremia exigua]
MVLWLNDSCHIESHSGTDTIDVDGFKAPQVFTTVLTKAVLQLIAAEKLSNDLNELCVEVAQDPASSASSEHRTLRTPSTITVTRVEVPAQPRPQLPASAHTPRGQNLVSPQQLPASQLCPLAIEGSGRTRPTRSVGNVFEAQITKVQASRLCRRSSVVFTMSELSDEQISKTSTSSALYSCVDEDLALFAGVTPIMQDG